MKLSKMISNSAIALLTLIVASPALAVQTSTTGTPSVGHSTAKVGILKGTDTNPTAPYDPNDPDHPKLVDPGDPADSGNKGTGNNGPLSLDYVSNLNFGLNKLDVNGSTYQLSKLDSDGKPTGEKLQYDPWVQVTDKRSTGAGWNLTVQYDADKGNWQTSQGKELKGAILNFGTPKFSPYSPNNMAKAPTATLSNGVISLSDKATNVATADKDAGMGTWFEQFSQDNTTLTVPAGNSSGDYAAKLVWTLTDAQQS